MTLSPQTFHQLCLVHMQRNVYKNMAKKDVLIFNQSIQAIKLLNSPDLAISQFQSLCEQHKDKYPYFTKALSAKDNHYFPFMNLPHEIKKYFYSTNSVGSFNSMLEKLSIKSGGFFQSEEYLRINIFFTLKRLNAKKWKKGVPHIIANLYSLRQLFIKQFDRQPIESPFLFDLVSP